MKSRRKVYYMGISSCETYEMVADDFTYYAGLYSNKNSHKNLEDILVKGRTIRQMFHAKGHKLPLSIPINTRLILYLEGYNEK